MTSTIHHILFQCRVVMLILMIGCPITTEGASSKDREAASYFQKQQYEEALEIWTEMVQNGQTGAALYHNIGLAESMLGHTVAAVLAYEKALRFAPSNTSIRNALVMERKKIENSTIPIPEFFLSKWYRGILSWLRPGMWAMMGLLFAGWLVFDLISSSFRYTRKVIPGRRLRFMVLMASLLFFLFAVLRYHEIFAAGEAIIALSCEVHQAPDAASPVNRMLHPGEKVEILDHIGAWNRISLLNLDEGWIRKDCLIPITP